MSKLLRLSALFALVFCTPFAISQLGGPSWTQPTAEELSMTSIPEVPGAPAVILFKEENNEDSLHMWSYYYRVKVLTEGGKEQANVELPYIAGAAGWSIDSISGRTVQPDGSVTVFSGKPYEKLIERSGGRKIKAKVFSLPNVQIGSILEYRYKLRYDDDVFTSPEWDVQSYFFTRHAHFTWRPTDRELYSKTESGINSVAWTPILPAGATVTQAQKGGRNTVELDIANVRPVPEEPLMPPMNSLSYRVMFYYTGYRTADEYWRATGKRWSADRNKFIGPGPLVKSTVQSLVGASDSEEQKLQKIYDFVETLDNTQYSRTHSTEEDRAQGYKEVTSTDEVLKRKRGTDDQITELFVAMVRAAGMRAYLMGVASRDRRFFVPGYLSLSQIDDYVAVVQSGDKTLYLDPGERYCTFGQLSWKHAMASGIRQDEKGTELASTPQGGYKDSHVSRIADLQLDEHGSASGLVTVTYTGDSALFWRQEALRGDDTSLNKDLRTDMENMLPGGMDVRVTHVEGLTEYAKPLKVVYEVKGGIGTPTGKRLLLPSDLFETNAHTLFTAPSREQAIDMHYPSIRQDAIRYKLPPSLTIESAPTDGLEKMKTWASYSNSSKSTGNSITLYRNLVMGSILFPASDYPDLRSFYSKLQAKDQEPLVLTRTGESKTGAATASAPEKTGGTGNAAGTGSAAASRQ